MYVDITTNDSGTPSIGLSDVEELTQFSVRVAAGCSDDVIASSLLAAGAGRRDGEDVAINVDWLRQCTLDCSEQWRDGFERMLDYAASKGWMDATRAAVLAHIETA